MTYRTIERRGLFFPQKMGWWPVWSYFDTDTEPRRFVTLKLSEEFIREKINESKELDTIHDFEQ